MYTCIAYLIEIRKFCLKTWFIKVLILRPKMLYNSPQFPKKFRSYNPGPPLKGAGERGRAGQGEGKGGEPPIHIPGYATG